MSVHTAEQRMAYQRILASTLHNAEYLLRIAIDGGRRTDCLRVAVDGLRGALENVIDEDVHDSVQRSNQQCLRGVL